MSDPPVLLIPVHPLQVLGSCWSYTSRYRYILIIDSLDSYTVRGQTFQSLEKKRMAAAKTETVITKCNCTGCFTFMNYWCVTGRNLQKVLAVLYSAGHSTYSSQLWEHTMLSTFYRQGATPSIGYSDMLSNLAFLVPIQYMVYILVFPSQ